MGLTTKDYELAFKKYAKEEDPKILKMEKDCVSALKSVTAALDLVKKSKSAKGAPESVGVAAVKDLTSAKKALEKLVGESSPYAWHVFDPDR